MLLSPELLYTALTRQQDRVVLLKQGDLSTLRDLASPSRSETGRRLTCLFRPADPFSLGDGTVLDGNHIHRTGRGDDLVRSKSEVIVADALHDLGLPYRYEAPLAFPGELPRHPDFTIHQPGSRPSTGSISACSILPATEPTGKRERGPGSCVVLRRYVQPRGALGSGCRSRPGP